MSDAHASIAGRKLAVLRKAAIGAVVDDHVKLTGSPSNPKRRGRCPFHNGESASFGIRAVGPPESHFAHCFGCGWHGDAIKFLADIKGWEWIEALKVLEREYGLAEGGLPAPAGRGPVQRERDPAAGRREREPDFVDPLEFGRLLWRIARREDAKARCYFEGRGIPAAVLTADRLASFRFVGLGPVAAWERGRGPSSVPQAPALVALVREPRLLGDPALLEWVPVGVHVTFLNAEGTGTMLRRKPWAKRDDPEPMMPKRKMLGPVGHGAVLLGEYRPDAALYVGEGNETVLSGMDMAGAGPEAVGVATLSLDNLQGFPKRWRNGALPLHAIEPDPERGPFRVPGHRGPVTGLIDADMSELKRQKLVEHKGGPVVERALTQAERAHLCAELFVKGWRAAGCAARAIRPCWGMDFNDAVRSAA